MFKKMKIAYLCIINIDDAPGISACPDHRIIEDLRTADDSQGPFSPYLVHLALEPWILVSLKQVRQQGDRIGRKLSFYLDY